MPRQCVCYCYVRVSHEKGFVSAEEQIALDDSIKIQTARCLRVYESRIRSLGIMLYPEVLIDPRVSAREVPLRDRPKGRWLDEHLMGGDHVVFAYFDRAVRQLRDWANLLPEWRDRGITVHFADLDIDLSTAHGRMVANLLASIAEHESELKSERGRAVAEHLARMGRPVGGIPPPGYMFQGTGKHKRLVHNRDQFPTLREIARLRDEERLTWRQIAASIESRQCAWEKRPFRNSAWHIWKWTHQNCRRAYLAWQKIQRELAGEPITAHAIEPPPPAHRRRRRRA